MTQASGREVYIVSAARTPMGSFRGSLVEVSATDLGATAIKGALERAGITSDSVEQVYFGNVLQAGIGQNPARQCALKAGLPSRVTATTVNKVCASGMKAISLGAAEIRLGDAEIVVAGGTESMSRAPYYLARGETPYGGVNLTDGLVCDGLTDAGSQKHMGVCAEETAEKLAITRSEQDDFAIKSYKKSAAAAAGGLLAKEIVPVTIPGKRGKPDVQVTEDEEYHKVVFEKVPTLRPVFKANGGTITAANASTLNDGAAACVLASKDAVDKLSLKPLARIVASADAAIDPIDFAIAPEQAITKVRKGKKRCTVISRHMITLSLSLSFASASFISHPLLICTQLLAKTSLTVDQIARFELNEAFSLVGLANVRLLGLDESKVNVNGGGVSLGHPLGCSGARIVNCLAIHLKTGELGIAGICNGGGGASAILLEKL